MKSPTKELMVMSVQSSVWAMMVVAGYEADRHPIAVGVGLGIWWLANIIAVYRQVNKVNGGDK